MTPRLIGRALVGNHHSLKRQFAARRNLPSGAASADAA